MACNTKKILSISVTLFACLILFSCKKEEKKVCWHCTFDTINGYTPPPKTICNNGENPGPFKLGDDDLGSYCKQQ